MRRASKNFCRSSSVHLRRRVLLAVVSFPSLAELLFLEDFLRDEEFELWEEEFFPDDLPLLPDEFEEEAQDW